MGVCINFFMNLFLFLKLLAESYILTKNCGHTIIILDFISKLLSVRSYTTSTGNFGHHFDVNYKKNREIFFNFTILQ